MFLLGILVELPLAPFFLSLLLGRTNTVHDMPAFDAQLARSLRLLRDYDGDVEDLCLSFAVDQYTAEVPPELRRSHAVRYSVFAPGVSVLGAARAAGRTHAAGYSLLARSALLV